MARPGVPSLHNVSIKLRVRRPTSPTSSQTSAEDTPIFMASKPVRRSRRSLSPLRSLTPRKKSHQSEPSTVTEHNSPDGENVARRMVNREISEWRKVCQTGRPSWWSPISKWTPGGARSTGQEEVHSIPPWCLDLSHGYRPEQRYDKQRRAVTDSYLADNSDVQDLAYLVAVQLLGACFTLPPEYISSYNTSVFNSFDARDLSEMPDSRLISSLRMHTEARHSPSFGHQARNTSPTYPWQGTYIRPSPSRSRGSSSDQQAISTGASKTITRKRRIHGALRATAGSAANCSMDSHLSLHDLREGLPTDITNVRHRLRDKTGADRMFESSISDRSTKSCPSTLTELDSHQLHSSRLATEIFRGDALNGQQRHRYSQISDQQSRQTMQSVLHSDPHHVYIQPVKELVVKRWRTLRRRFAYDHHRDSANGRANTVTSALASSRSTPAEGGVGNILLSNDGKERRCRARIRGDINSNSIASSPRSNTPTSTAESEVVSPEYLEHPSPDIHYRRNSGVANAFANAFAGSGLTTAVSLCFTPPNSLASSNMPSPSTAPAESPTSGIKSGYFISAAIANSKLSHSPSTASTRRHGQRRHQRSNLSEICTPEDTEERSLLSGVGTVLTSPKEESGSEAAGELTNMIPKLEIEETDRSLDRISPGIIESGPRRAEAARLEPPRGKMRRPSMVRTSTSGTQVFTPSEDGIELDGLPTGPPSEIWNGPVQGNKRKERSYL